MAISFVAATSVYSNIGGTTSFTVDKPSGTTDGDLMVASICFDSGGALRTITLSGWTLVKTARGSDDSRDSQVSVYVRTFVSGDPTSWNGTISSSSTLVTTGVATYRGVQAVGASGTSASGVATSYATATVNSTVANSWRVVCAAYDSATTNYTISSNETTRRILFAADDTGSTGATQAAIWDSDTTVVATGNTSRTVSRSASWSVSSSVILLLQPSLGTPATGGFNMSLNGLSQSFAATANDNATMSMQLSSVSIAADGYGQPPVGTGTFGLQLNSVSEAFAASVPVSGSMDMMVLPSINIQAETRVFGIRVIAVEEDDRTIVVPSRGVDD